MPRDCAPSHLRVQDLQGGPLVFGVHPKVQRVRHQAPGPDPAMALTSIMNPSCVTARSFQEGERLAAIAPGGRARGKSLVGAMKSSEDKISWNKTAGVWLHPYSFFRF